MHGIELAADQVVLAGERAIARATGLTPKHTLVLGNAKMRALAKASGVTCEAKAPETVVLMRDQDFNYDKLCRAVEAVARGARLICANPDLTHPGRDGRPIPETGALLAAIIAAAQPDAANIEIIGKPSATLFRHAVRAAGVSLENCMMIGDNPETDIAGAEALGIPALHYCATSGADLSTEVARFEAAIGA